MENQEKALYHCSQEELYTIAEIGWDSCLEYSKDFAAMKARYTPAYIAAQQKAIADARDLGTSQARAAGSEMAYTPLKPLAEICLDNYHLLSAYIDDAYDEANEKAAQEAAGSHYYAKASNDHWISLRSLNSAALLFIQNNTETLSQNGDNMPAAFPQQYSNAVGNFDNQYMVFIKANQKNPVGTTGKITANNNVYKSLTAMFRDGIAIFRRSETIKPYFTFDDILHHITGERTTGVRFEAIEAITELPVPGVSVTAQPGNTAAATAEDGIVKMPLPENTYTLTISVPAGFEPIPAQTVKTITGIMHRKKFVLKSKEETGNKQ